MTAASPSRQTTVSVLAIVALALLARLVVLPFATTDGGDAVTRTWAAMRWLADPELITHGVWGPLHFYLVGAALAVVPDPIHTPVVLHIGFALAASCLIYFFTREEFASSRAALVIAALYALYPVAIRNSVSVRSETVFVVGLLAAMLLLALARGERGRPAHAAGAGLALTLAAMLRYEAWLLLPFLALLLWRKPRLALLFGAVAMIHPLIWMVGNWVEFGDPLHSINWASRWERELMGRADRGVVALARQAIAYPYHILLGMNLLVGLLAAAGALTALWTRDRASVWLVPLVGLCSLMLLSIMRGSLVPKLNYTLTAGTMLLPFAAIVLRRLGIDAWSPRRYRASSIALLGTIAAISCVASWDGLKFAPLARRVAVSSIPTIENQAIALSLPPFIAQGLHGPDEGLITDFYGWGATFYVALLTGLHPDRIFRAPGAPHNGLDVEELAAFVDRHRAGVLVLLADSQFSEGLGRWRAGEVEIDGQTLALRPLHAVDWPTTGRDASGSRVEIFRYQVAKR